MSVYSRMIPTRTKNTSYLFQILKRMKIAAYNRRREEYLSLFLCLKGGLSGRERLPSEADP